MWGTNKIGSVAMAGGLAKPSSHGAALGKSAWDARAPSLRGCLAGEG